MADASKPEIAILYDRLGDGRGLRYVGDPGASGRVRPEVQKLG
jgi:hypothetical protein